MKRAQIETGITELIGGLETVSLVEILLGIPVTDSHQSERFPKISHAIQPTPNPSPGSQGAQPQDRGSVEGTPGRKGARERIASSGIGHNAGTFVMSTNNADDDADAQRSEASIP